MATKFTGEIRRNEQDLERQKSGTEQDEVTHLQKQSKDLDESIEKLQAEIKCIKQIIEEEEQYTSASRDARKMYGDITPGDTTHQDVVLMYQNHFKHAFRTLPKALIEQKPNKFETWKMCGDIVQESFETNKKRIIKKMMKDLKAALDLKNDKVGRLSESKRDLHRAFKMMLSGIENDEVLTELDGKVDKKACDFVMSMIKKLDPADYNSFLEFGELRNREKDIKQSQK